MRTYGRVLAFGAICAGAPWLAGAPASALTLSVGGTTPVGPISLPLPPTSVSVGVTGPVAVDVQAPGSTAVSVTAGRSGLAAKATTTQTPLVDVSVGTPDPASVTAPITATAPVSISAPGATPTPGAPTSSVTPADPSSGGGAAPKGVVSDTPGARGAGVLPLAERDISSVRDRAGNHSAGVTASIASSPQSDLLSSLPAIGARLMLWLLLAGVVVAMRLFMGSATSRAPRAS